MTDEAHHNSDAPSEAYLWHLQALASEIQSGIDAISRNELNALRESVARQEMLAASLQRMAHDFGDVLHQPSRSLPNCMDAAVQSRIQAAGGTLRHLNMQYAVLLQHSSKTVAMLASLCRSHAGNFREDRNVRSKLQTWSCEM